MQKFDMQKFDMQKFDMQKFDMQKFEACRSLNVGWWTSREIYSISG